MFGIHNNCDIVKMRKVKIHITDILHNSAIQWDREAICSKVNILRYLMKLLHFLHNLYIKLAGNSPIYMFFFMQIY